MKKDKRTSAALCAVGIVTREQLAVARIERRYDRAAKFRIAAAKQNLNAREARAETQAALIERDNRIGDALRVLLDQ